MLVVDLLQYTQVHYIKGNMWLHKSDVTDEAFNAVAQYCLEHNEAMNFNYKGKRYRLAVTEIKTDTGETE